ncbi:uncharacterized protein MONOS_12853 [Monocercomonoides exilis]|uniref:uncharacterized protein n=1 Tax=Monocercomonoides exilis TaxID=2049356 RepID=UPI00355A9498|nr:hypothetical protein MONOS_12853 [Monocercomonoides exilis]|eukprot:MONOS_12853.1-p1 / transcript=MONOS_12853.1 / gene=MONOS_12853 / organism=Monocercomonoides_exilis_PA203 / gene_product=unspecified product / transcript_product=unspecified product / location=Mono_scaffold00742:28152-28421(-) / protein_length=90 / sequence_SO=supercontig / SO=protein_coding / is_pseudo=false
MDNGDRLVKKNGAVEDLMKVLGLKRQRALLLQQKMTIPPKKASFGRGEYHSFRLTRAVDWGKLHYGEEVGGGEEGGKGRRGRRGRRRNL